MPHDSKAREEKELSHLTPQGAAQMVDVSPKPPTARRATAEAFVSMTPALVRAIRSNQLQKGDLLATARLAGIGGGKRTADLIPLCHPLPLDHLAVDATLTPTGVHLTATATTTAKTGVEMEALTAAAIAALTVIDMGKALDPAMTIQRIQLLTKTGGKQDFKR